MIQRIIEWSVHNRFLVLLATLFVTVWGIWSVTTTPIDALPDLSDVQVLMHAGRRSRPCRRPRTRGRG